MPSGVYQRQPKLFHLVCKVCKTGFFAGTTAAKYCPACRPDWNQIKKENRKPKKVICNICGTVFETRNGKRKTCFSEECKAERNRRAQKTAHRTTRINFQPAMVTIQAVCPYCRCNHPVQMREGANYAAAKWQYCQQHEGKRNRVDVSNSGYGVHI